jgi:hypothetical protein
MFALFAGRNYYPSGGWDDLINTYPTLEEAQDARNALDNYYYDWWQIVDMSEGMMVEQGSI